MNFTFSAQRALLCALLAGGTLCVAADGWVSTGRADCALPREALVLLTPAGARIPPGAGLAAMIGSTFSAGRGGPTPRLTRGGSDFELRRVPIAPGIERLEPVGAGPGRYFVEGLGTGPRVEIEIAAAPMPPSLPAPRPRAAVYRELEFDRHAGQRAELSVDLGAPVPAGAVAIIGRWAASGHGGVGAVRAGERVVIAYRSVDGCDRPPPDVGAPRVGTSATFAFVDALGRPGAWSALVLIGSAPRP